MHLRTHHGGRRWLWLALALGATTALADQSLWLVHPLYPGQEALVERTETALGRLMPPSARQDAVIGRGELVTALKGRTAGELPCFSVEARCADPIDAFVGALGFERVVMIQGGQDEAGFTFRVTAYEPKAGKVAPAAATNANLEKALLGAVARVVPVASTLEVKSAPAGATVYVDDVKVGLTPLSTQVLPGERVVRLDLKLHQPVEETLVIPIRGTALVEKSLEKVAARIVITAAPAGTEILIDGVSAGKDKVDRGISPGDHTVRLVAEKHKAFEQTISVQADQQYALDKTLEPLPGAVVAEAPGKGAQGGVGAKGTHAAPPPPAPPPPPKSEADKHYERRSYFHASFEQAQLLGSRLVARRMGAQGFGRTTALVTPSRSLVGGSLEYGTFGKYFGVTVVGLSYLTNIDAWGLQVGFEPGKSREVVNGTVGSEQLDRVRTTIVTLRALQPQVRLAAWRFMFGLQAGFEFRTGHVTGLDPVSSAEVYKDGFWVQDLMVAGRLNVRFTVVEGLFLHLQANYAHRLLGPDATDEGGSSYVSSDTAGFNVGVGYGF